MRSSNVTISGPKGDKGDTGDPGTNGLSIINGEGPPSDLLGVDGEFYLDTLNWNIHGPKASGTWPAGVSIIGEDGTNGVDGTDGNTILSGTSDPTTEGNDGDFYINTSTSYLFGPKASGVWPTGVSLIGPEGSVEEAPEDGKTYGRKDGAWVEITSGGGDDWTDVVLQSDQTIASNTLTDLTGLNFSVVSGGVYRIEFHYTFSTSHTSNGIGIAASLPNRDHLGALWTYYNTTSGAVSAVIMSASTIDSSNPMNPTTTARADYNYQVFSMMVTFSADGTFQMQARSENNGPTYSVTVRKGSHIRYKRII